MALEEEPLDGDDPADECGAQAGRPEGCSVGMSNRRLKEEELGETDPRDVSKIKDELNHSRVVAGIYSARGQ